MYQIYSKNVYRKPLKPEKKRKTNEEIKTHGKYIKEKPKIPEPSSEGRTKKTTQNKQDKNNENLKENRVNNPFRLLTNICQQLLNLDNVPTMYYVHWSLVSFGTHPPDKWSFE